MPVLFFDPGQMTARLELEKADAMSDGQGGASLAWVSIGALWARIEPVNMVPDEVAGQERGLLTHRIWIRHRADIETSMRLRKGGRIFDIRALRDPDETRRYLVCLCEEGRP